ncbi:putative transcriptional regulator with C-terminal CBS domains [Thiovulum sp. ES]|nr:putative transcriptional regulator with C-terminal CBS domains [Thiovulum sp. ES]
MEKKEAKNEENLVKKTCRELGITQKELAEKVGVSEKSITNWANNKNKPPKSFFKTVELLKQAEELSVLKKSLTILKG